MLDYSFPYIAELIKARDVVHPFGGNGRQQPPDLHCASVKGSQLTSLERSIERLDQRGAITWRKYRAHNEVFKLQFPLHTKKIVLETESRLLTEERNSPLNQQREEYICDGPGARVPNAEHPGFGFADRMTIRRSGASPT
ncbi:hypothetical protein EVAR_21867_1 [Eumeta japonica]|uniref:Uncharacterized protein n=1 Tax=Eumeta variegata TaxID=151549 RepID=A0A4C1V8W2_EUMVA|nr:hypothetical protein EVAR_21867_1 [Eumeta japonica]